MPQPPEYATPAELDVVRNALRRVVDPEVGMNIVDLGLIYRIDIGHGTTRIDMTMTSPACPMGDMILDDVRSELAAALPDAPPPDIRLVWEPPWNPSLMSAHGKKHFGWQAEAPDN